MSKANLLNVHMLFRAVCIAIALATPCQSHAQSSAFYTNKTISFVIGYSAGGGYDTYARLVARYLGEAIEGQPIIIPRNMPGASSRVAVSYVFNAAPRDGLTLCTGDQSLSLAQAMGDKLNFDMALFNYIGNPSSENNTTTTWAVSGIKNINDAKTHDVTMGATGGSPSSQYPRIMNALIGTHFKIVLGYPGGNEINLAMERGEVAGRGSNSWGSWKATHADWLTEHKINILVQIGLKKAHDLPDVPLLMELASTDHDRQLLKLLSSPSTIGRPVFTTPFTGAERVKAMRDGFDKMITNPVFLADAEKLNLDIDPVSGDELQKIVSDIIHTPPDIAHELAVLLNEDQK
jgi:tripartite-type tricarboxylate transporter receptor subunit TctC